MAIDVLMLVPEDNHIMTGLTEENKINYINDTPERFLNLYSWIKDHDPDVVHFQYLPHVQNPPIRFVAVAIILAIYLIVLKFSKYNVVWTAHHLDAHEQPIQIVDRGLRWWLLRVADVVIILDEKMVDVLNPITPSKFDPVVAHLGDYQEVHPKITQPDIKESNKPIVGVVGHLRKYKRVPLAVRATNKSTIANSLLIAGSPNSVSIKREIETAIKESSIKIISDFRYVPDDELSGYVEALDCILILNEQESVPATLHLAAAYRTPVVTTCGGVSESLVDRYKLGTVADPNVDSIADAIDETLSKNNKMDFESFQEDHSWGKYRRQHRLAYNRAVKNFSK